MKKFSFILFFCSLYFLQVNDAIAQSSAATGAELILTYENDEFVVTMRITEIFGTNLPTFLSGGSQIGIVTPPGDGGFLLSPSTSLSGSWGVNGSNGDQSVTSVSFAGAHNFGPVAVGDEFELLTFTLFGGCRNSNQVSLFTGGGQFGTSINVPIPVAQEIANGSDVTTESFDDCGPTPVELTLFEAEKLPNGQGSLLYWQTANEIDNDYFSVQRSVDGGATFEEIGVVEGAGTTNETLNYEFIDKQPIAGNNYYRLKQVDFDGDFEYSEIKALFFTDVPRETGVSIFPNPAVNLVNVRLGGDLESQVVEVEIYNSVGQLMTNKDLSGDGGIVQTSSLPSGVYTIVVRAGSTVTKENIVVNRE